MIELINQTLIYQVECNCSWCIGFHFLTGQMDMFDNGSSGDTSEELMLETQNPRRHDLPVQQGRSALQEKGTYQGLWSNSSR